jgi:hypothetical protein
MKKIVIAAVLCLLATTSFGQQNNNCIALWDLVLAFDSLCDGWPLCETHTCAIEEYYSDQYDALKCGDSGPDLEDEPFREVVEEEADAMDDAADCIEGEETNPCSYMTQQEWDDVRPIIAAKIREIAECSRQPLNVCTAQELRNRCEELKNAIMGKMCS